jgi:hypothetical protein
MPSRTTEGEPMARQLGRHKADNSRRPNDFATLDECARIAANMAERVIRAHEQQRRDARWYRRLLARLRRTT